MRALAFLAVLLAGAGCGRDAHHAPKTPDRTAALRNETLPPPYDRLRPLATPLGTPAPGNWLSIHDERGQSLKEYDEAQTPRPTGAIVLARLGNVMKKDWKRVYSD